jgi:hypothetical protein
MAGGSAPPTWKLGRGQDMKQWLVAILVVLGIVGLMIALSPEKRDEIHWRWASLSDSTSSYKSYVEKRPEGQYIEQARARYDEYSWTDAQSANTVEAYEHYLQHHSKGKHAAEAKRIVEATHWQEATTANTIDGYERYLQLHSSGEHIAEAKAKIESIRWQEAIKANNVYKLIQYIQHHSDGKHVAEARDRIQSIHWQQATRANTIQGYQKYLKLYPKSRHVVEAKHKIQFIHWQRSIKANTIHGYKKYLNLYPTGKLAAEAKAKIELLNWQEATKANTVQGFKKYLQLHKDGKHAAEAKARISDLLNDPAPYKAALRKGTEASLRQFLAGFPGHAKEKEAQEALKDITYGRDIVDLLKEKKIEVETQGSGIKKVRVRIRKLVEYSITVRIPVGSYFVSARKSAQNMVSTAERKIRLSTEDWISVDVSVACANRPKDIPGSGDSFRVQRSPHQAELARLMPVLDKARVPYAVRQGAVWIVTDNANYRDLGALVITTNPLGIGGGTRQIKELETARAMKICDEAGIDITRKRVWRDRNTVIRGLPDSELKRWLKAKK